MQARSKNANKRGIRFDIEAMKTLRATAFLRNLSATPKFREKKTFA